MVAPFRMDLSAARLWGFLVQAQALVQGSIRGIDQNLALCGDHQGETLGKGYRRNLRALRQTNGSG